MEAAVTERCPAFLPTYTHASSTYPHAASSPQALWAGLEIHWPDRSPTAWLPSFSCRACICCCWVSTALGAACRHPRVGKECWGCHKPRFLLSCPPLKAATTRASFHSRFSSRQHEWGWPNNGGASQLYTELWQ